MEVSGDVPHPLSGIGPVVPMKWLNVWAIWLVWIVWRRDRSVADIPAHSHSLCCPTWIGR